MAQTGIIQRIDIKANLEIGGVPPLPGEIVYASDSKEYGFLDNTGASVVWTNFEPAAGNVWGSINGVLSNQTDLQNALDLKIDITRVLTDVPAGALFTDTVYDDTSLQAEVTLNTAKVSYTDASIVSANTANIGTNTTNIGTNSGNITSVADDLGAHKINVLNPHSVTKAQVGLGNCDDISDADKPVSDLTQDALDLKVNLTDSIDVLVDVDTTSAAPINGNSLTFNGTNWVPSNTDKDTMDGHIAEVTGNPHNVTKTDLVLENVNNTTDLNKPISLDAQAALDLKAEIGGNPLQKFEVATAALADEAINLALLNSYVASELLTKSDIGHNHAGDYAQYLI